VAGVAGIGIATQPGIRRAIREIAPDAVLLTPAITGLTPETDY
jgi:hypothetical protein